MASAMPRSLCRCINKRISILIDMAKTGTTNVYTEIQQDVQRLFLLPYK